MTPYLASFLPQGPEMIIIFIVILLLFGAKKLPELARGLGKSMGEFRRAKNEFDQEIRQAGEEAETAKNKAKSDETLG